jgi:hypothetical protein
MKGFRETPVEAHSTELKLSAAINDPLNHHSRSSSVLRLFLTSALQQRPLHLGLYDQIFISDLSSIACKLHLLVE